MTQGSIWSTWKPYAVVAALAIGFYWWYTSQSSFAELKSGRYDCVAVYVNSNGKYELITDSSGNSYRANATVSDGRLISLTGDSSVPASELAALRLVKSGNAHFHVTDDAALHSYEAVACDISG